MWTDFLEQVNDLMLEEKAARQVSDHVKLAEICLEHLKKGSHVACRGHLEYREYETKSGEKRRAAEIHLDEMQRL